jgi:CheY-specific phosphatase CheX
MNPDETVLREASIQAALEVLETMFFEIPVEDPQDSEDALTASLCALASFTGSAEGVLAVSMTPPALERLSASFLGADESEISDGQAVGVLCELANMLCGSTISRLDPGARIAIAPPQIVHSDQVSSRGWLRFPLECGSLAISLIYRGH